MDRYADDRYATVDPFIVGVAALNNLDMLARSLLRGFREIARTRRENAAVPVVPVLTFRDVVDYFTTAHPADPRIRAGALLHREHPAGHLIFQVFLDDADAVCADATGRPYGRQVVAADLDAELADRFRQVDLLVFR